MNKKINKLFIVTSTLYLGLFTHIEAKQADIEEKNIPFIKQLEMQNGTTGTIIKIINKQKYSYAILVLQKGATKEQQEKIEESLMEFRCNKENASLGKKVLICPIAIESLTNNDIARKYNIKEFPAAVIINDKGNATNTVRLMNKKKLITNKSFNNLLVMALKRNIIKQKNELKKEAKKDRKRKKSIINTKKNRSWRHRNSIKIKNKIKTNSKDSSKNK